MKSENQGPGILIIASAFSPSAVVGAKRFIFLSSILKRKNNNISILTLKEKYLSSKDNSLPNESHVYRSGMILPYYKTHNNKLLKKIYNFLWRDFFCLLDPLIGWIPPAILLGMKIIRHEKVDLIIATGPNFTAMVIGYLLSLFTNAKLVLDYRDPWSNHNRRFCKLFGRKINRLFELLAIRRANALVFCSGKMKEDFVNSLGRFTRATCYVVNNGFQNRDKIVPLTLNENCINMIYAGVLYGERRMKLLAKPLFQLLYEGIIDKNSFSFHIFGGFIDEDRKVINKYGLQKIIKEHAKVPYDQIIRYLKGADILFLPSGSDVSYAIPFKFYDYISVKRPIFAVAPKNSAVAEMMKKIDCGRFALINDYDSILENLRKMLSEKKMYSFSGAEEYTWENVGSKYIKVINEVYMQG